MKKYFILLISIVLLTGCNKKVIDYDYFTNVMESEGLSVNTILEGYENALGYSSAVNDYISFNLLNMNSVSNAKSYYDEYISSLNASDDDYIYNISKDNYSKYILDNDTYTIVYRVSNVIIIANCESSHKNEMKEIFDKLVG